MQYSKSGLNLTESFEGFSLHAYPDSGGIPTIGYGHTKGVKLGDTCTRLQAEMWLLQDIDRACVIVDNLVHVPLDQDQFDALVDFVFNVGGAAFKNSTILQDINLGNFIGAASEFEKWDHVSGKVVAGLLRRRIAEENLFKA